MEHSFIFHIAQRADWESSSQSEYIPENFETEGFIHCSTSAQVVATAERHFKGAGELLLLKIDPQKIKAKLKYEAATGGEKFPHIYGHLNREAVIAKTEFRAYPGTGYVLPSMAGESIFSKIIRGDFPSYKLFENAWVYCLLTRDAIRLGHALIIPKVEVDHFSSVPDPFYSEMFRVGRELSHAIQKATGCKRIGAVFAGYEVAHCHLHLIPTDSMDDFDFRKAKVYSAAENQQMLEKVRKALTSFTGSFGG